MVKRQPDLEVPLIRFATRLREEVGASRVLLFGSRSREAGDEDRDYDLIIVSPRFVDIEPASRAVGLRAMWRAVGGRGPLDLVCVTPQEFDLARTRPTLIAEVTPEAIEILPATR